MAKISEMTDSAVLAEVGDRLAQHRLQRNLTQAQLAREAGISKRTLIRVENGDSSQLTNLIRLVRALGLLDGFDAFVPPAIPSPIEQMRSRKKERRRASSRARATRVIGQLDVG
jgi:putative transcriptional regulator